MPYEMDSVASVTPEWSGAGDRVRPARASEKGVAGAGSAAPAAVGVPFGARAMTRVSKGVGALFLNSAVNVLGQISLVPIALVAWGAARYGEWVALTGLVILVKLADLGLQTFVVNRLCASYARNEREEMHSVLHSALRVQLPLVGIVLLLLAAGLWLAPLDRILRVHSIAGFELAALVLLVAFEVLIAAPMGVIIGLYRATGRFPRSAMIGACQQFLLVGLTLALVAGRASFLSLALARVGVVLLGAGWVIYDLGHLYPWLRLWPSLGAWREGVAMMGPGLFFLLIPLADYLSAQFTLLVIQKTLSSGEVSRLATHRTLVNVAPMVSNLLMYAMWPELTALYAREESSRLVRVQRSLARLNVWLVGAVIFGMLPLIPWIYPAWTAGQLALDSWTLTFLITRTLLWGMWNANLVALLATNRHKRATLGLLGSALITSALAMILVPIMGMRGAALAALLGDLCVVAWFIPILAARAAGDSGVGLMLDVGSALLKGIGIPVAFGFLSWFLLPVAIMRYLIVLPLCGMLAGVIIWRQLIPFERQLVLHFFRSARQMLVTRCRREGLPA
ncbi:MAG: lipopolysaccharide biosynthesis protein [Acidobacteria bacterium]|nr:lipopolysaccharide biosynthesis protein [Acidobacteriota bacterium]MBI3657593.1 lipopolysaccharide biosynthesis protein [Acidobacteriota bacterium]